MQPVSPNQFGVLPCGHREVVAQRGRSFAAISFALGEDGMYRHGIELFYSYGGFGFAIDVADEGYPTLDAARTAGLECLLKHWHRPFPSDPASIHAELDELHRQVEACLRQPSLF